MLQIIPPVFTVYSVHEADKVFEDLNRGSISGRAVYQVSSETLSDDDAEESDAATPLSTSNPDYALPQQLSAVA